MAKPKEPLANPDTLSTAEDTTLTTTEQALLANDFGKKLDITAVGNAQHGTVGFSNGNIVFTPDANFNGAASFDYTLAGSKGTDTGHVTVNVSAVNDAPTANSDSYTANEDSTLTVPAPGVLGNDTDVDGDTLSAHAVNQPARGSLSLNADGSFTYTPEANFFGQDSFTYAVNDGTVNSAPATVALTVQPVNDAPAASNDSYSMDEDTTLTVPAPGVLGNDTDVEGDTLSAHAVSQPAHGSLSLNADGSFTYTPEANFFGEDSFTYAANDGTVNSTPATVAITVSDVPDGGPATMTFEDGVNGSPSYTESGMRVAGGDGALDFGDRNQNGSQDLSIPAATPAHRFTFGDGDDPFTLTSVDIASAPAEQSITGWTTSKGGTISMSAFGSDSNTIQFPQDPSFTDVTWVDVFARDGVQALDNLVFST